MWCQSVHCSIATSRLPRARRSLLVTMIIIITPTANATAMIVLAEVISRNRNRALRAREITTRQLSRLSLRAVAVGAIGATRPLLARAPVARSLFASPVM